MNECGLTSKECDVLVALASAWNVFVDLPPGHPDDTPEFRRLIHAAQAIIGSRVATRVDPTEWAVTNTCDSWPKR